MFLHGRLLCSAREDCTHCCCTLHSLLQGENAAGLFIVFQGHCNCYIDSADNASGFKLVKVVKVTL